MKVFLHILTVYSAKSNKYHSFQDEDDSYNCAWKGLGKSSYF